MTRVPLTPPQTVGPFFHDSLLRHEVRGLVPDGTVGGIRVEGTITDGRGERVNDAMVEIWQADSDGRYRHPADAGFAAGEDGFVGYGRAGTDEQGRFWFTTVKPGAVAGGDGVLQAPHLVVQVFARGLLDVLTTRLYFEDEAANDTDPVLATVPEHRRATLMATSTDGGWAYGFDIVLQGERETVFFDLGGRRVKRR